MTQTQYLHTLGESGEPIVTCTGAVDIPTSYKVLRIIEEAITHAAKELSLPKVFGVEGNWRWI